jgi:hypothetical protein
MRSLLGSFGGTLGGKCGGKLYISGVAGYNTPIWDVLALQGEREEAGERLYGAKLIKSFPIRQVVPVGLAWDWFCSWARCAWSYILKNLYLSSSNLFKRSTLFLVPLGWREWMDGGQWIWMLLILIILSIILNLINKYINLEPKETILLGSCIGTWNELLEKKRRRKKQSWRALSAQLQYPLRALVRRLGVGLAQSFIRLIALSSVRFVGGSIGWGRSLVVGFCPLPLSKFTLRRWALPLVVGFCLPSLGSALRHWAVPFVVGLYTLRRWAVPLVVGLSDGDGRVTAGGSPCRFRCMGVFF